MNDLNLENFHGTSGDVPEIVLFFSKIIPRKVLCFSTIVLYIIAFSIQFNKEYH